MTRSISNTFVAQGGGPPALITHRNRESLAPFVLFDASPAFNTSNWLNIDWHPHSGVATVTLPFSANLHHADSEENDGIIRDGGLQWMASGNGVWHNERYEPLDGKIGIHQLWVLLPPEEETAPVRYENLQPEDIPTVGNTRVLLGEFNGTKAGFQISQDVSYLEVRLNAGETWQWQPPTTQTRGFVFPRSGRVDVAGASIATAQMGQFNESSEAITVHAKTDTTFVVATAAPWPHPIVHEYGQMHTNKAALAEGKKTIRALGEKLQARLQTEAAQ